MVVVVLHQAEELKIISLQKDLISILNDDSEIWYSHMPLWIELPGFDYTQKNELKDFSTKLENLEIYSPEFSKDKKTIFLNVVLKQKNGSEIKTTLPLLHSYRKSNTDKNIELPKDVQIKSSVFRLGFAELHNSSTAVQSCKTSSYILKDSVWFKQSK